MLKLIAPRQHIIGLVSKPKKLFPAAATRKRGNTPPAMEMENL